MSGGGGAWHSCRRREAAGQGKGAGTGNEGQDVLGVGGGGFSRKSVIFLKSHLRVTREKVKRFFLEIGGGRI